MNCLLTSHSTPRREIAWTSFNLSVEIRGRSVPSDAFVRTWTEQFRGPRFRSFRYTTRCSVYVFLRTQPPGVPIPARGSARCEDDYAGPVGLDPSSHSRGLRVVLDFPGARRVRGPHASRRRFPPVEVFGIPGRDHVGRKEVRLPDLRSKFGGDHTRRGGFQGGGNGALE